MRNSKSRPVAGRRVARIVLWQRGEHLREPVGAGPDRLGHDALGRAVDLVDEEAMLPSDLQTLEHHLAWCEQNENKKSTRAVAFDGRSLEFFLSDERARANHAVSSF